MAKLSYGVGEHREQLRARAQQRRVELLRVLLELLGGDLCEASTHLLLDVRRLVADRHSREPWQVDKREV